MQNDIRPEVRGIRLLVGAVVTIVLTYWFITGKIFRPFAMDFLSETAGPAYASPVSDAVDILTAIFYVVGTITTVGASQLWRLVSHLFSVARDRFTGGTALINLDWSSVLPWEDSGSEPEDVAGDSVTELTLVQQIANRMNDVGLWVSELDARLASIESEVKPQPEEGDDDEGV